MSVGPSSVITEKCQMRYGPHWPGSSGASMPVNVAE